MSRLTQLVVASSAAVLMVGLAACSSPAKGQSDQSAASGGSTASSADVIVVEHAFGSSEVPAKPERVATVNWANHEVPLALGVVPVGMAAANFGDDDGNGLLPWVEERLTELGAETPVLFDETDGIDFEAVANTQPDVILAAYSGLTQKDYDTLSEIAPVVAYPDNAWGTPWRQMIELNAKGMGMEAEGKQLVADLEEEIATKAAAHKDIDGKSVMFLTHVDPLDLSEVSFYTAHDTRTMFFEDLGMTIAEPVAKASAATDKFSETISTEQADSLSNVEIIVTYGGDDIIKALNSDPVLAQIPAVANGAIVNLPGDAPLGIAANPTPLSISWILDDYLDLLSQAAARSK